MDTIPIVDTIGIYIGNDNRQLLVPVLDPAEIHTNRQHLEQPRFSRGINKMFSFMQYEFYVTCNFYLEICDYYLRSNLIERVDPIFSEAEKMGSIKGVSIKRGIKIRSLKKN